MARTYLLNTLQKWAKELCSNSQDESRKKLQDGNGLTRREFVTGLGAVGVMPLLPKWGEASANSPRIAIVGGGIAGLSCALALQDRGVQATIYEASHRVGGRMFSETDYWNQGQISEWCGELIDSGHQTVRSLARRFNLPLDDLLAAEPANSEELYYFSGYYTYNQAKNDFAAILDKVRDDLKAAGYPTRYDAYTPKGQILDHMSISDWIDWRVPGGHDSNLGQLLDVAYNIEYDAETSDQSALNLLYLLGYLPNYGNAFSLFGVSDERFHIRGGNQKLPEAIRNHLGDSWFQFGMELRSISLLNDQSYRLRFRPAQGGGFVEVNCDYVVLAIPFAVLRDIDYSNAGFDGLKHTAIQQLGRGRNGKLQLQFNSRFWSQGTFAGRVSNGSTYSDTGYQCSWEVTRAQTGSNGILNLYSGGSVTESMGTRVPFAKDFNALANLDANTGLMQLQPVFPGIAAAANGKLTQSLPHLSPYFKASYSYYRVGQYTAFGGHEGATQGAVLFCGEHTSQDFQGYMEGGASEGERAAKELLQML